MGICKETSQNDEGSKIAQQVGKNILMVSIWKLDYQKQMTKRWRQIGLEDIPHMDNTRKFSDTPLAYIKKKKVMKNYHLLENSFPDHLPEFLKAGEKSWGGKKQTKNPQKTLSPANHLILEQKKKTYKGKTFLLLL